MKLQLLFLASASLLLSLPLSAQPATQAKSGTQPYKLQYNNLKFGNPAYAQKLLQVWKDYDNNQIDAVTSVLADNAVAYFPNGTVAKGADNINQLFRKIRNSFTSLNSDIYACTTIKSSDDPEHEFAVIWGLATYTKEDGSIHKTRIHEVWRFNNQGKVDEAIQYVIQENAEDKSQGQDAQVTNAGQTYPILKNLRLGNPAYSDVVLKVWKDFENNSMDNSREFFNDDVIAYSPHGNVIKGKENMLKGSKQYRNGLRTVAFKIVACTTLKSPGDPDHEIVMIWAERNYINMDGSIQKTNGQEAWYFNRQGKVDKIFQFSAAMPADNQ